MNDEIKLGLLTAELEAMRNLIPKTDNLDRSRELWRRVIEITNEVIEILDRLHRTLPIDLQMSVYMIKQG